MGRVASLTTPEGTTTYGYDARSQLESVALPDGTTRRYDVDAAGNRLDFATDGFNRYTIDPTGRMFQYDAAGNLMRGDRDRRFGHDLRV